MFSIVTLCAEVQPSPNGTVLDVTGRPIPGATVTVRNESSGVSRLATGDSEGKFSVEGLPDGTYTIEASAPSFASSRRAVLYAGNQPSPGDIVTLLPGRFNITMTFGYAPKW